MGVLPRRIGGARVLLAGVALWSLGTLVAPPAAKLSLLALCASRVFVSPLCRHLCELKHDCGVRS
jgi:ACS family sodium-dependent inorganic phosphate cotransporter